MPRFVSDSGPDMVAWRGLISRQFDIDADKLLEEIERRKSILNGLNDPRSKAN